MTRSACLFLFSLLVFCRTAFCLTVPDKPDSYVNDYARLLSSSVHEELEKALSDFDRETSHQLLVAVFPGLEGENLEDFSIRLAGAWKPGTAKKDNGVILLVFRDDRAIRIEVGYGLEGVLPDARCDRIIRGEIVPHFREGRFDEGVRRGVEAVMAAARGEPGIGVSSPEGGKPFGGKEHWTGQLLFVAAFFYWVFPIVTYAVITGVLCLHLGWVPGLFLGMIASIGLAMLRDRVFRYAGRNTLRNPRKRQNFWWGGGSVGGFGGFSGGGFSGGFSGGGGGFGGGGASGRW